MNVNPNPVIKKSTSGILSGVYRYTYVMNNPLKYTDPSGYAFTKAEILMIIGYLMGLPNGGSFSSGGDGSGPSVTPYNSANDAFQAGFEQKFGFEPGCTLEEYTNAFVRNGYDRALGQFKGFDGHFFERDSKTGDFYVPGTDEKINPVDVFTGEIDWFQNEKSSVVNNSTENLNTYITEQVYNLPPKRYPFFTVYEKQHFGHVIGNGHVRIKNGKIIPEAKFEKGKTSITVDDRGGMINIGNFSIGVSNWMLTTSFKMEKDGWGNYDSNYLMITNQYQLNPIDFIISLSGSYINTYNIGIPSIGIPNINFPGIPGFVPN